MLAHPAPECLPAGCLAHLVPSQDLEGGDDLVGRVCVGGLPRHEVDEGLEGHEAAVVGVHYAHDAVELGIALPVVLHVVAQADEAGLELLRPQRPAVVLPAASGGRCARGVGGVETRPAEAGPGAGVTCRGQGRGTHGGKGNTELEVTRTQ